jgi:hypothetical protein
MFHRTSLDISSALDQANEYRDATWKLWRYTTESKVLVLCVYRPVFKQLGYLAFRRPEYVCLPWLLTEATFALLSADDETTTIRPPPNVELERRHEVMIQTPAAEYRVVCEEVAFYQVEGQEVRVA